MTTADTKIDETLFQVLYRRFKDHLETPENYRTILSGNFGSGKTTFLKYFFNKHKEHFVPLYIYPVHYSIATNEDIYRYIKYDLFFQLLAQKGIELATYDLGITEKLYLYLSNNFEDVMKQMFKFAGAVGKFVHPTIDIVAKVAEFGIAAKKHIEQKANDLINKKDEMQAVAEFLKEVQSQAASLYENSFITQIIENAISQIKTDKQKVVLVIEDLDRVDPEHIFRILNIFSAHFENPSIKTNQFGIDTIVAVCDETNIRNIFHNKYGSNVDYSGYLDKFYSTSIFHFSYSREIAVYVAKYISKWRFNNYEGRNVPDLVYNTVSADHFLEYMLDILLRHKLINLRSINRVFSRQLVIQDKTITPGGESVNVLQVLILLELLIVVEICGGIHKTLDYLDRIKSSPESPLKSKGIMERVAAILTYPDHSFQQGKKFSNTLVDPNSTLILHSNQENQLSLSKIDSPAPTEIEELNKISFTQFISFIEQLLRLIEPLPEFRLNAYFY